MKKNVFFVAAVVIFIVFNYGIYLKEELKNNGEVLLLELAPADPRSLMQGDYMQLRYAVNIPTQEKTGYVVMALDKNRVAKPIRLHGTEVLNENERLLRYHNEGGKVEIVPNSFMFQEGHAKFYDKAKYGVFKFDTKGNYILVGLAGKDYQLIKP